MVTPNLAKPTKDIKNPRQDGKVDHALFDILIMAFQKSFIA